MTIVSATLQTEDHAEAWSRVNVAGADYLRQAVHTRWLQEDDELILSLKENLRDARLGDTVAVSEKVVILLTGRVVDIGTVKPGPLALMLARHVRPRTDSCGLSVPEKMEYVVRSIGRTRAIAAALGCALTRPLGVRGAFYRLAGSIARDIDGGRPPYEKVLFPPLTTAVAQWICADLEQRSRRWQAERHTGRWVSARASSTSTTTAAPSARLRRSHFRREHWQRCSATIRWASG